jgi:glycine cleavage system H protein
VADYPADLKYTAEHEWLKADGKKGRIGITAFAQDQLGDVVYVELPKVGARVTQMAVFGVIDSVKASSDLYSPVTGTVTAVNEALTNQPELVNKDPYGEGWMMDVDLDDPSEVDKLMDSQAYAKHAESSGH